MRRLSATAPALLLLALWACEGSPTHEPPVEPPVQQAASVDSLQWLGADGQVLPRAPVEGVVEGPVPVRVRALGPGSRPVAGVEVKFSVKRDLDTVTVATMSATTDSAGVATASAQLVPGINWVYARAGERTSSQMLIARARFQVNFTADTLTVLGPGCGAELFAPVSAPSGASTGGHSVAFTATVPGVVEFTPVTGYSGTTRGMRTGLRGLRAGETLVIGTEQYGAADTMSVRVLPPAAKKVEFGSVSPLQATGGAVQVAAKVNDQCGQPFAGAAVAYRSLNPRVASVDASGRVALLAPGTAAVEASWNSLSSVLLLDVKTLRLEPADTTVAVGDTVRYRALLADSTGVFAPSRVSTFQSSDTTVATITAPAPDYVGTAVAVGEGTVQIRALAQGLPATLTLRVRRRQ
jgi:plastocyanin